MRSPSNVSRFVDYLIRVIRHAARWYTGRVIAVMITALIAVFQMSHFYFTYVMIACLFVYSVAAWVFSDRLAAKRTLKTLLYLADGTSVQDNRTYNFWVSIPIGVLAIAALGLVAATRSAQVGAELQRLEGRLYPAGESISVHCPLQGSDDLVLMIGNNEYVETVFPHTIIAIDCDDILQIERESDGSVGINLKVFGEDRRIVVEIDHGYFRANQNNIFKIDRHHSRSTLSVYDQFDREVLYLHLANRNVLQMRALIYDPRLRVPLRIDEHNSTGIPGVETSGACFFNNTREVGLGTCLVR
jgi:hypothetical protein